MTKRNPLDPEPSPARRPGPPRPPLGSTLGPGLASSFGAYPRPRPPRLAHRSTVGSGLARMLGQRR